MNRAPLLETLSEAAIAIAQAGIGAFLGYLAGIRTFKLQIEASKKIAEEDAWQASFVTLGQIFQAVCANLNDTANFKSQIVNELRPVAEIVDNHLYEYHTTSGSDEIQALKNAIDSVRNSVLFFKSHPKIFAMDHPSLEIISKFTNEMPSLNLFLHNSTAKLAELNERIQNRNRLIEEFSRENAGGITQPRLVYFFTMLSSEAIAISKTVDATLGFQKLAIDQIEAFMKKKSKGAPALRVTISPSALSVIPPDTFLADYRQGLKTFEA